MLNLSSSQTIEVIARQRFLEQTADIEYTCYAQKCTLVEFFQVNLWNYLKIKPELVEGLEDPIIR